MPKPASGVYSTFMSKLPTLLLCLAVLSGCASTPPPRTVDRVDLKRFMGDWYVISLLPWFGEKGNVNTMDIYALRPDGKIDVTYAFRKGTLEAPRKEWKAKAWAVDPSNARWKVQFVWPFAADYLVLALADDYRYTVIGHPSRGLAWIMSRTPKMSQNDYEAAILALKQQDFDTNKLEKVRQP